jgi:hypothetical protein
LGQEHPDLALIVAILVSTGWNGNDDVFTPEEVWKARLSPLHKPMNDNHQADNILGHIVQTRVLDKLGNEITDDTSLPSEFDIEVAGVLYRAFPKLSTRINEIISKAQNGEMFVSMEAWFPDFGYGLIDPITGDTNLIERTENTAFLTKHLRIYGGCGEYQGYRVGRVLKDIIFGAQGFTEDPANPESVIKVAAKKMFVTADLSELLEGGVEDVNEEQMKELQDKLDETQVNLEEKTKEVVELQKDHDDKIAVLATNVEELTASVAEALKQVEAVEAAKNEIQKQLDEATELVNKSEAELEVIRKNGIARDRLSKLSEVKKIEDQEMALTELREMTDETFAVVLKYAGEVKADGVKSGKTDAREEVDQAKAVLDEVQEDCSADFSAAGSVEVEKVEEWKALACKLTGQEDEKDEGGE